VQVARTKTKRGLKKRRKRKEELPPRFSTGVFILKKTVKYLHY
jgi:hypothetical protein